MGRIEPIGNVICTHQLLDRYISNRRHFDDLWIGFGTSTPAVYTAKVDAGAPYALLNRFRKWIRDELSICFGSTQKSNVWFL
jgi:hypothetical protein